MSETPEEMLRKYFSSPPVLEHYLRATAAVGLWRSEQIVFERYFAKSATLLEVGCGTGRIAMGLHELGYRHLLGIDLSRAMIEAARDAARSLDYGISFQVADACALPFEDGLFDGAIFGFNGLMQIPGRERRRAALREIRRVIASQGILAFTTHDRASRHFRDFWEAERVRWDEGKQDPALIEFGDRILPGEEGQLFIHVPSLVEVREDLDATGWELDFTAFRRDIANESQLVRDFADECRFFAARNKD